MEENVLETNLNLFEVENNDYTFSFELNLKGE